MENADEAPRFPPSHRACYEKQRRNTVVKTQTIKEGGLATATLSRTRGLHPTVSSCRHPTVLVDAGHPFQSWQSWEHRVGEQLGLTVVRLRPPRSFTNEVCDEETAFHKFRQYLASEIIPQIRNAPPRRQPEMLPRGRRVVDLISQFGMTLAKIYIATVLTLVTLAGGLILGGTMHYGWPFLLGSFGLLLLGVVITIARGDPPVFVILLFFALVIIRRSGSRSS